MIFRGLCILASWLLVVASPNKDEESSPATGVQRQFIGSQAFGQNPFSQAPPFAMPSNGMNPFGGMNDPQPNANQLQLLAAMQKDPRMRQQMSGLLQQMGGGGGGIGQPLGENGFRNEESTLMQNPITAPDGLTKDVLKSLMLGNVGDISPPHGNRMGDMMNSFSNGPSSRLQDPRKLGNLVNSFANRQAGSEGFPTFPKFNFGRQEQPQEDSLLHARHHRRHGNSKKGKSDTVTKLLLSLLVDKLKDIYEMDKFNTSTLTRKQKLQKLETTGKIGNDLHSDGDQENNPSHDAAAQRDQQRKGTFHTNLTFPLTVSDQKSTDVQLIDSAKKGAKKNNNNFEVDSATIATIIKGIEANQTLKLTPALSKPVVKTGVNRELKDINNIDAESSTSGLETAGKSNKGLGNEDFIKNPDTGSFAEFHTIKMPLKSANQNQSASPLDEQPITTEDVKTMVPLDGDGVEKVTSLPSFSVSPFLNKDKSQSVTATDRVFSPDSVQSSQDISSTEPDSPKDPSSKPEDASEPRKQGSADNYLEASRVLGSVYNKVTDPLAKKSVETAIKAMLKLIRSESPYSKKGNVPSVESVTSATDYRRGQNGLGRSFDAFVGGENGAVKKGKRVRAKMFSLKTPLRRQTEKTVREKIITRSKQAQKLRKGRICKCERLARILKRKRKSLTRS